MTKLRYSVDDKHPPHPQPEGNPNFPPAFLIGPHTLTSPLVNIEYAKAHLRLLGAFAALRQRVFNCTQEELPPLARNLDNTPAVPRRWAWFLCLAVDRFQRWIRKVKYDPDETLVKKFHRWVREVEYDPNVVSWVKSEAPPLDVLMVWHAYMLNPAWYAEDSMRLPELQTLQKLDDRLIPAVLVMGDPLQYKPTDERKRSWLSSAGTPFDPIEALTKRSSHTITCPKCGKRNEAEYLTPDGTGYAQQGFQWPCSRCAFPITKAALAIDKLAQDLVKEFTDEDTPLGAYLPGTLRDPTDALNTERAVSIKKRIIRDPRMSQPEDSKASAWCTSIKENFEYSITNVNEYMRSVAGTKQLTVLRRMLDRILSTYTDDLPFSTDLVGAVIRQGSFTSKMHDFGWTAPGYFDNPVDEIVLVHSITRYHAFMDMMSASPASFFVPTLDIDLVWHTHQLTAGRYAEDCKTYVGRYVDHDDKVEENRLANGFDLTCKAWQHRFKVPYSYCGCPLPGDSIGDKLQRLTHKLFSSSSKEQPQSSLKPSGHPAIAHATHASEHNAIHLRPEDPSLASKIARKRRNRERKMDERRARDLRRVQRGELDPEQYRRGQAHYAAFLTPVPFLTPVDVSGCVSVGHSQCAPEGVASPERAPLRVPAARAEPTAELTVEVMTEVVGTVAAATVVAGVTVEAAADCGGCGEVGVQAAGALAAVIAARTAVATRAVAGTLVAEAIRQGAVLSAVAQKTMVAYFVGRYTLGGAAEFAPGSGVGSR
ncbi:hypothetical protein C8Q72DRAFT_890601 [Fomitopsis betulina]|nr:hypothetical protein C8Q72DRAFT_890601 [Fomitopsis betulina]